MSKKPETLFKDRLRWRLDALPRSWWLKLQLVAHVGLPDIIGCVNGQFVAIELKKDQYTEASRLQRWCLDKIIKAGGFGVVVSPENCDQLLEALRKIAKGEIILHADGMPDLNKLM